jgi:chorismate mutase
MVKATMQSKCAPDELLALRDKIDKLDEEIVATLARRFAVTSEVGQLKADHQLNSVDPAREQEKLARLKALAEDESLNSEFILELFQKIFDEVVKNHRSFLEK